MFLTSSGTLIAGTSRHTDNCKLYINKLLKISSSKPQVFVNNPIIAESRSNNISVINYGQWFCAFEQSGDFYNDTTESMVLDVSVVLNGVTISFCSFVEPFQMELNGDTFDSPRQNEIVRSK